MAKRVVTAGILKKDSRILIAKRQKSGSLAGKWEFPGGKVEEGETEQEALGREFREELGIEIEVKDFLCSASFSNLDAEYELHAYWVELLKGEPVCLEHESFAWVKINELAFYDFAQSDKTIADKLQKLSI